MHYELCIMNFINYLCKNKIQSLWLKRIMYNLQKNKML